MFYAEMNLKLKLVFIVTNLTNVILNLIVGQMKF